MNSCIIMAQIVRSPELRYTQDNQTPLAEMLVEFEALRADDPPVTLKVVGWGNLASEIQQTYSVGDRVVIEGRLRMNTVDRTEGFKEKRAELTASRVHKLDGEAHRSSHSPTASTEIPSNVASFNSSEPATSESDNADLEEPVGSQAGEYAQTDKNLDDIPF